MRSELRAQSINLFWPLNFSPTCGRVCDHWCCSPVTFRPAFCCWCVKLKDLEIIGIVRLFWSLPKERFWKIYPFVWKVLVYNLVVSSDYCAFRYNKPSYINRSGDLNLRIIEQYKVNTPLNNPGVIRDAFWIINVKYVCTYRMYTWTPLRKVSGGS